MTIARGLLVPEGVSRCYHCISRCVRQAFLCDDASAHRKDWIKHRLTELSQIFAVEVGGYAIMGNHLHVLVRTQPELVEDWSDEQIATRWLQLYPRMGQRLREASGLTTERDVLRAVVSDREQIKTWRARLASLSWFMKCLKEPIARRANREENVTGHFWEGRFKVRALLDEAAVLACLVYIDLNPIRARAAPTPELSDYTSVQERIRVRQRNRRSRAGRMDQIASHDEDGSWLVPIEHRGVPSNGHREGLTAITLDEYLTLVDLTGRQRRPDRRGAIPPELTPILSRLELDVEKWLEQMIGCGRRVGTAVGSAVSLATEAARRGTRYVISACPVYQ